jgi:FkbM family methyltransferase
MLTTETYSLSQKLRNRLVLFHKVANLFFNITRFPGSRKFARLISRFILPELRSRIICPTIFDFDLVIKPENGQEIYDLGFYEVGTLNVIGNCLKKGDVFIDVGASIGLISLFSTQKVGVTGMVVSFEPTLSSYTDLCDSVLINNAANIKTLKMGLGSQQTEMPIYFSRACPSMIKTDQNDQNFEVVPVNTLDNVLNELSIPNVKMIKIDVEGFELEVLQGGSKLFSNQNAPIICIEYISKSSNESFNGEEAMLFIKKINDYRFYQLTKTSSTRSSLKLVNDIHQLRSNDNVFCFTGLHLKKFESKLFSKSTLFN